MKLFGYYWSQTGGRPMQSHQAATKHRSVGHRKFRAAFLVCLFSQSATGIVVTNKYAFY